MRELNNLEIEMVSGGGFVDGIQNVVTAFGSGFTDGLNALLVFLKSEDFPLSGAAIGKGLGFAVGGTISSIMSSIMGALFPNNTN